MDSTKQDKATEGAEALETFLNQFGEPCVYSRVLLEELFRILLSRKDKNE